MLISLAVWSGQAHALGLGAIALQSGLGKPLQASIPVYGLAPDDAGAACLKSRVLALDGSLLARPSLELAGTGASAAINIRTVVSINEPAVTVSVEIGCTSAIRREYSLLLDPAPATLPMASSAQADRMDAVERKVRTRTNAVTAPLPAAATADAPAPAAVPASVVRKLPKPARPKPLAETKSVLTLAGGDAEIEQVRARLALRSATVLSEPRIETDPARLAAQRADQARVAALLRGEDPAAGTQAQLRDAEARLLALQKSAASATRLHEQEKAALMEAQNGMVSVKLLALLGGLLSVLLALVAWLLRQRAVDRRRREQAFFATAAEQDAAAESSQAHEYPETRTHTAVQGLAAPLHVPAEKTSAEVPALDFAMPAEIPAPATALSQGSYDWRAQTVTPVTDAAPPETLQMPDSWLTLENTVETTGENPARASDAASVAPALPYTDDARQVHAAEVADMLLAAESWMAEHNPLRAAEVLRPYLDRDDVLSPAPGLYLLSLYRTMDDKGQIATVLAQLQPDFPAQTAAWSSPGPQVRRSMADFPAVHAVVDSLSDSDKLLPYLNSLLLAPEPFDFSTYRDIVRAIGLAREMQQENGLQSMSLDFQ